MTLLSYLSSNHLIRRLSEHDTFLKWSFTLFKLAIPVLAIALIWNDLHSMSFSVVQSHFVSSEKTPLVFAALLAVLAVAAMGLYDVFAFEIDREKQPLNKLQRWMLGSAMFAWSNLIGFGPALRTIVYAKYGYTFRDIGRGMAAHYLGSACGIVSWLIACFLPLGSFVFAGVLAVLLSVGLTLCMGKLMVFLESKTQLELNLANQPFALLGLIAFFEWGISIFAFVMLANAISPEQIDTFRTMGVAVLGWSGGLLSMIPGGFGAADAIWLHQFSSLLSSDDAAAAAVLTVRVVLYFLPWALSLVGMYWFVLRAQKSVLRWQRRLVAGALVAVAGVLLLSAATPSLPSSVKTLSEFLPLPIIEGSHALSVLLAITMLLLVRGIVGGYLAAYRMALAALIFSLVVNLLKGIDVYEATSCAIIAAMLFGVRRSFTREGRVPMEWYNVLFSGAAGMAFFWVVGFVSFENIPYRPDLWLEFSFHSDAARFIRMGAIGVVVILILIIREAIRPARRWLTVSDSEMTRAEQFANQYADNANALLVGGGDKAVWWLNNEGFLLYQAYGDKFYVHKDPILSSTASAEAFLKAFLDHCDAEDMEPVFSMVSLKWIEYLHEFGFYFTKVSEEAIVDLRDYTIEGSAKAEFRRTVRNVEKTGVTFTVLSPPHSRQVIESLARVSDAWIQYKGGHELQFSACYFSANYLARHPISVATQATGEIVAFANLLCTRINGPCTIDFMRYVPDSVDNVMDYLLIKTQLYLAGEGYSHFSLGTVPLTDVGTQKNSRWLERWMYKASKHAEHLYNYSGLRFYKNKFKPEWTPRYIAYLHPWNGIFVLASNARLVQARSKQDRIRIAAARRDVDTINVAATKESV